ncbi:MAG TPA: beta-eliminating lyase-related protein [Rhizomicrobium sp.]|nr:beta-eliminating lyase-related protein [Rhizomicrobium sp.]
MNFASDNVWGAAPEMLAALAAANGGAMPSYGEDPLTERLAEEMARVFERPVAVFPVISGTAANALALATITPPHGAILCHEDAHIVTDECGAPEFFTQGARLATLSGHKGKLAPETIGQALSRFVIGSAHSSQPAAISITQATEWGTCYRPEEIAALAAVARHHGLKLHMDGARFANAIASLGCTPAEATWKAGVDVLSFGATKNGALAAEAVIFFEPRDARDFEYRRKRSGHLASKLRFVSAQLICALEENRWLAWAARANAFARALTGGLRGLDGVEIACAVEANAVFAWLPESMIQRLRAEGASFYDWSAPAGGRTLVRMVTSFATPEHDIERFLEIACR